MPIAIAADAGWKRPTIGPGLEDFVAGDPKAAVAVAAGGPADSAIPTSTGATTRIQLDEPAPPEPAPAPSRSLTRADLLGLLAALTSLLAALTGLVARLVEQRGLRPAGAS